DLANFAVGLEHTSIHALHLAMIGDMIANGGLMVTPTMQTARRSILGDRVAGRPPAESTRVVSAAAAARMAQAMRAVIAMPHGTGHRAAIEGLDYAIKTGTAGERPYEALIVGFAPAVNPKIAFGLVAHDSGPAEIAGARMIRDFLIRIRDRLSP
ncbi:MAG TPA: penicillin-binding transpeptidase domain-containing protein, partial [Thermoanaerobaculia bacterium]|nr:penicillin-binding transpeptidase domain-containing protein [Thermoanaerobaculia bacterium]